MRLVTQNVNARRTVDRNGIDEMWAEMSYGGAVYNRYPEHAITVVIQDRFVAEASMTKEVGAAEYGYLEFSKEDEGSVYVPNGCHRLTTNKDKRLAELTQRISQLEDLQTSTARGTALYNSIEAKLTELRDESTLR